MGLRLIFFLWSGSAALRRSTESVESQPTVTVTVEVSGPAFTEPPTTISILKGGETQGELKVGEPKVFSGVSEGELLNVGTSSDKTACSYEAGRQMTVCFLQKVWKVVFKSQEEVEETLNLNLRVTRKGSGTGPPFVVKINGVTRHSDSGTVAEGITWWRLIPVDADVTATATATVLFTSTNTHCTYTVAIDNQGKQKCEADGMEAEFETVISKSYTYDWNEVVKRTDVAGWKAHVFIEGNGPQFNIFLDAEKIFAEEPSTALVGLPRLFDAELNQTVKLVFGENEHDVLTYRVGDEKQTFKNFDGYTIDFETIPKGNNE